MGKLIEDLDTNELDYWVAKARGWEARYAVDNLELLAFERTTPDIFGCRFVTACKYKPSVKPAQWAELIEEFNIHLSQDILGSWMAGYPKEGRYHWNNKCDTPAIAICRAVIASVYGKEVPGE